MRAQSGLEAERRERPNSRSVGSNSLELELERRKDLANSPALGSSKNVTHITPSSYHIASTPAPPDPRGATPTDARH